MRTIVSNLTAAMLIVHTLVGCCRHADFGLAACEAAVVSDRHMDGCCHHDRCSQEQESEGPGTPCDCALECKTLCVSLPPQKTLLDVGQSVLRIDVAAGASSISTIQASTTHSCHDELRFGQGAAPPLRLHLLHEHLLV